MRTDSTQHIYYKVSRTALVMLCLVAFFSCVKVDLCREESHVHAGTVKIVYHWPENIGDERPDSMLALVNRMVHPHHIGYVTGPETSDGGRYRFGEVSAKVAAEGTLVVEAGKYQIIAFNNDIVDADKGDVRDYNFVNLSEFGDGQNQDVVGVRDLGISYVGRDLSDPRLELYGKDWQDTNPYSKYIASDSKPIYFAVNKGDGDAYERIYDVHVGQETKVDVYPYKITQDITFSFPIYTEKDQVAVDSIIAEISGIPHKMMLYSGALDIDRTYKMLFKIDVDADAAAQNTTINLGGEDKEVTKWEYLSTISVMGLVSNKDARDCTGAGILQLCVYASTVNADGEKVSMTPRYARINLYNTIQAAKLVVEDPLNEIYVQNPDLKSGVTLRLDSSLVVVRDGLQSSDSNAADSWTVF